MSEAPGTVVVLYEHSLLGEGIGRIVSEQTGAGVTVVPAADRPAVERALASGPDVVIFQAGRWCSEPDLARAVPAAVLIDVSTAMSAGTALPVPAAGLDRILHAVRGTGRVSPGVAGG